MTTKTAALDRFLRIQKRHAIILSSVHGTLFPRDAKESQDATDALFATHTDAEILAIATPELGQVFDAADIQMIRAELQAVLEGGEA